MLTVFVAALVSQAPLTTCESFVTVTEREISHVIAAPGGLFYLRVETDEEVVRARRQPCTACDEVDLEIVERRAGTTVVRAPSEVGAFSLIDLPFAVEVVDANGLGAPEVTALTVDGPTRHSTTQSGDPCSLVVTTVTTERDTFVLVPALNSDHAMADLLYELTLTRADSTIVLREDIGFSLEDKVGVVVAEPAGELVAEIVFIDRLSGERSDSHRVDLRFGAERVTEQHGFGSFGCASTPTTSLTALVTLCLLLRRTRRT